MTEAQDIGPVIEACDSCGAGRGEPCAEDCAHYQDFLLWAAREDSYAEVIEPPPSIDSSLSAIAAAVHRLPFGGNVGLIGLGAPDRQDYTPEEYLDRLATWLTEYQEVVTERVADLSVQSRQRIAAQIELDILHRTLRGVAS